MTNDLEKRLEEVVKPVFTDKKIVCKKCGVSERCVRELPVEIVEKYKNEGAREHNEKQNTRGN